MFRTLGLKTIISLVYLDAQGKSSYLEVLVNETDVRDAGHGVDNLNLRAARCKNLVTPKHSEFSCPAAPRVIS